MQTGDLVVASTVGNQQPALKGSITVQNSSRVHVGHRTYYNAPVTVLLPDTKLTLSPEQLNKFERKSVEETVVPEAKFRLSKKKIIILTAAVVAIVIVVVVAAVLSQQRGSTRKEDIELPFKLLARGMWFPKKGMEDIPSLKEQPVQYVVLSETSDSYCNVTKYCRNLVRKLQGNHLDLGLGDIAYNFLIAGDGGAYEGRGWDKQSGLSSPLKTISLYITFMGYFEAEPPPRHQIKTFESLIERGIELNKITPDYKLFALRQVLDVQSPKTSFFEEMKSWKHFSRYDPKKVLPA